MKSGAKRGMPRTNENRQALLDAVSLQMREVTGLSMLYSQAMASRLGINSTDLECLGLVAFGPGATAGALAERTGLTTGSITTVIDRLERAGFVQRRRDDDDRRKVVVVATSAMKRRGEAPGAPMRKVVNDVLSRYEDGQLQFLIQVLGELCEAAKGVIASAHEEPRRPRRTSKSPAPRGAGGARRR
jgi:DNA-binding MarR family transcriptional regulator